MIIKPGTGKTRNEHDSAEMNLGCCEQSPILAVALLFGDFPMVERALRAQYAH